jgi:methionine sulfoxide reductase catalytic subunit
MSIRILPSEITPQSSYLKRRLLLQASLAATGLALPTWASAKSLPGAKSSVAGAMVMEKQTSKQDATSYNNFYEFGTEKDDPARNAHSLRTRPWTVSVEGECLKPRTFGIEELLKLAPMEERIYRLRCVEGWSMVIPWVGYSMSSLLKLVEPTGKAKFVEFVTLADKAQMPGLRSSVIDWPYLEGLRLDEAMHPLAILSFGMYGELMPNQSGAPVRMVVPWKYGFKSGKSIVKIRLTEKPPVTSWMASAPREYGFFSNVNPQVDHPRWSQATERRIGEDGGGLASLFAKRRPTLMFNGYADQVGQLYAGMDLRRFF